MIELVRLSAKDAVYYWDAVTPLIIKGLERTDGEYSLKDYQDYIESQYWDLWIAVNLDTKEIQGVAVTEIIEHPNFNELLMRMVIGKQFNKFLLETETQFQEFAKENNCKRLVLYGRKGWLRVLNKINWKEGYTVMTKNIEKGE
jgi:hypothetical protein